ncbi:hypothetical protein [Rhodococcus erythropolis]|uniref:hypothetical protein n=1 Tax=Rhodococcus erythropolis TaxID=1833 RepID=UPI0004CE6302|nr:hypothetical protein [Rhodococcus erythropolis]
MAKSPAHRLGQIIGYALERSLIPLLQEVADAHSLYLDTIRPRAARNGKKLLTWVDDADNKHNLDFVLERNGAEDHQGTPVAFIEVAWRRYSKHSVNKAGEIANALVPLRQTYARTRPFTGAVVAGIWTEVGLQHMLSQGIRLLYIPLDHIVQAFSPYGIDLALEEGTSESFLQAQVDRWDSLTDDDQEELAISLLKFSSSKFIAFRNELDNHLKRQVSRVLVLPLHGETLEFATVSAAAAALMSYQGLDSAAPLRRVEVQVRYSNGDKIDAEFADTAEAITWLEAHA